MAIVALDNDFTSDASAVRGVWIFANEPEHMWVERPVMKLGTKGFDSLAALHDAERRGKGAAAELRASQTAGYWRALIARALGQI